MNQLIISINSITGSANAAQKAITKLIRMFFFYLNKGLVGFVPNPTK